MTIQTEGKCCSAPSTSACPQWPCYKAASSEVEGEFSERRDQLTSKLRVAEQYAKESLAESSKTEWTISAGPGR